MIITTAVRYAVTALHSCCFYVSARADWLVEALCSQVVHVSVHSSVTKLVKTIFWKQMNRFDTNWHKCSMEHGREMVNCGVGRSKVKITRGWNRSQKSLSARCLKNCSRNVNQTWQARIAVHSGCAVTAEMRKVEGRTRPKIRRLDRGISLGPVGSSSFF